ncbi:ABC transporter ATP-binding protein [Paenibacillus baekrokdamisoli]|uniref:ABC transporter ATP-binding protein n=1 Tax=Paenibacillus baekrokdamisoli TaxID=1712516 RepID=A0A3G9J5B3_9BACL|nr:ABC transporter ATP-binding protein [Paenibacillus baekrokdamisoli]MBB3070612.1 iron complex transport system ATP-binding protein [Paenibacillus baekrokdamisoli]BBH19963.1 ABC transporter ATP-binding protein [Paenibacillus baekrokdamisoli]
MIEVRGLVKEINGNPILNDLSFILEPGSMYGIIGPNGVGKSTLLHLLSGVDKPTSGEVLLEGRVASSYNRKEVAKWVAVLQQGGLGSVGFTVREVVAMGRYPFQNWMGEEKADQSSIIDEALQAMGLTELQERRMDQLSGGERQRVALAKVMVQEPRLLLLDEPTTFLDIGFQVQLLDIVKGWQRERKMTVVAVLHDLNLAAHYCDKLLVLHEGHIEAFASAVDIIEPQLIERVFGARTIILTHPETGVPQLLLHPSQPSAQQEYGI